MMWFSPDGDWHRQNRRRQRRGFLAGTLGGALAATHVLAQDQQPGVTHHAPPGAIYYPVPLNPTKVHGRKAFSNGGYGTRSQFESEIRWLDMPDYRGTKGLVQSTMTPLQNSQGIITPSALHYERYHAGIANINPARHHLLVDGLVERPMIYTMEALRRYPSESRTYFLECSGNTAIAYATDEDYEKYQKEWVGQPLSVQQTHGMTSTSEWTGVPVRTILEEVGLKDDAAWVIAEGSDAAIMSRSICLDKCLDDALLAYAQNGEALRPEQGFPLRLFLPGWEGNMNIKWLRRLYVTHEPFQTREETSRYSDLGRDGEAEQFTFLMHVKSVITFPSFQKRLDGAGYYSISGLAWSGQGRVASVEVATDEAGTNWQPAELQGPILPKCHTRFRFGWQWDGKPTILRSRCRDEHNDVQPTRKDLVARRGHNYEYHYNAIQSWKINADGSVEDYRE